MEGAARSADVDDEGCVGWELMTRPRAALAVDIDGVILRHFDLQGRARQTRGNQIAPAALGRHRIKEGFQFDDQRSGGASAGDVDGDGVADRVHAHAEAPAAGFHLLGGDSGAQGREEALPGGVGSGGFDEGGVSALTDACAHDGEEAIVVDDGGGRGRALAVIGPGQLQVKVAHAVVVDAQAHPGGA